MQLTLNGVKAGIHCYDAVSLLIKVVNDLQVKCFFRSLHTESRLKDNSTKYIELLEDRLHR